MNSANQTADPRQRVADYTAVLVLTRAAAENVDVSTARLGGIVAAFLPTLGPAKLREWSEMDMAQAVRSIKIDLLRLEIARAEACSSPSPVKRKARRGGRAAESARSGRGSARTRGKLSEVDTGRLDEQISQSVVASFYKFVAISALHPDWFSPYIEDITAF